MTEEETMDAGALRTGLRAALPKAVNFRIPLALPVSSPTWDDIADELAAAILAAREPVAPAEPTDPFQFKRGWCAHGNPCRESMCVEYGRREPVAPAEAETYTVVERLDRPGNRADLAQPPLAGDMRPAGPWTGDPADYDGDEGR